MIGLIQMLAWSADAHADYSMYYEVSATKASTYEYNFRFVYTGSGSNSLGWLIIGSQSDDNCKDGNMFTNPVLIGSAPSPWTGLTSSSGAFNGATFDYVLDQWTPGGTGDWIEWTIEADNLIDYSDPFYWSSIYGSSTYYCYDIVEGDTDGDGVWEDFCTYAAYGDDTDTDGVIDVCDPCPDDLYDDSDGDGVCDSDDVCIGDDLSGDTDADGFCDSDDICPGADDNIDTDLDTVPDGCDVCEGDDASGDADADGFCASDVDSVEVDCDDSNPDTYPGAAELCDGLDNACTGTLDSAEVDADADGVFPCDDDCDDDNADTYPGAAELCDGLDNDCDGALTDEVDEDGDGLFACEGDCDDTESLVSPDEAEVCDDGLDNNCDGEVDEDCASPDTGDEDKSDSGCSSVASAPGSLWGLLVGALMITLRRRQR